MRRMPANGAQIGQTGAFIHLLTKRMGHPSTAMAMRESTLGACPECGATVGRASKLVSYERDGQPAVFADCPGCRRVVRPE